MRREERRRATHRVHSASGERALFDLRHAVSLLHAMTQQLSAGAFPRSLSLSPSEQTRARNESEREIERAIGTSENTNG